MKTRVERATAIYEKARTKAMEEHREQCRLFMAGKISMISQCGIDREREYIIKAFAKELKK